MPRPLKANPVTDGFKTALQALRQQQDRESLGRGNSPVLFKYNRNGANSDGRTFGEVNSFGAYPGVGSPQERGRSVAFSFSG